MRKSACLLVLLLLFCSQSLNAFTLGEAQAIFSYYAYNFDYDRSGIVFLEDGQIKASLYLKEWGPQPGYAPYEGRWYFEKGKVYAYIVPKGKTKPKEHFRLDSIHKFRLFNRTWKTCSFLHVYFDTYDKIFRYR